MTDFSPILTANSAILKDFMGSGREFPVSEMWKSKPVCVMAVVHETLGAEEFKQGWWPNAPIYLDTTKAFYRYLGHGSLIWADPSDLTAPETKVHGDRARAKGVKGNLKGEGRIMGGLVVGSTKGVVYAYVEKIFGDHAPLEQVFKATKLISSGPSASL